MCAQIFSGSIQPEELKPFESACSYHFLLTHKIADPVTFPDRCAEWFHTANVLLETTIHMCLDEEMVIAQGLELVDLKQLLVTVKTWIRQYRESTKLSLRQLAWTVRCRLHFVEGHLFGLLEPLNEECLTVLRDMHLIVQVVSIDQYTLYDFHLALDVLRARIGWLRYNKEFELYFTHLRMCCARFLSCLLSDRQSNYKPYTEESISAKTINQRFLSETELAFFHIEQLFDEYHTLEFGLEVKLRPYLSDKIHHRFHQWLSVINDGPYKKVMYRFLENRLFALALHPGDREIYVYQNAMHSMDDSANTILSSLRPRHVDQVAMVITNKPIETLLEQGLANGRPERINLQRDYDEMAIQMIVYRLNEVLVQTTYGKLDDIMNGLRINPQAPRIVFAMNEYFIQWKGLLLRCPTISVCFVDWLRMMCTDKSIKGDLMPGLNLLPVYRFFFGDTDEQKCNELEQYVKKGQFIHKPGVQLPDFYK